MAGCVVCGHRQGSEKCPGCGGDVCALCLREGLCWNCLAKRREDAQQQSLEPSPPAKGSTQSILEFPAHLNTRATLIEGTLRISPDWIRFSPADISEIARRQYSLDMPLHEVLSCTQTFTTATLVNGFCIHLTSERQHCFVCDNAQTTFEAISRFLSNRPNEPQPAGRGPKVEHPVRGSGVRIYRCPQCEGENFWSSTICIHCNCPLPAHSLLSTIKILYSDQPCLMILIALLIGMGLLAWITRLLVG